MRKAALKNRLHGLEIALSASALNGTGVFELIVRPQKGNGDEEISPQ